MVKPSDVPVMTYEEAIKAAKLRSQNPDHIANLKPVFAPAIKWSQEQRKFIPVSKASKGRIYFENSDGEVPQHVLLGTWLLSSSVLTASGNHIGSYTPQQMSEPHSRLFCHEKYGCNGPSDAQHKVQIESLGPEGLEPYTKLEDAFIEKLLEAAKNGDENELFVIDDLLRSQFTSPEKVRGYKKFSKVVQVQDTNRFIISSKSHATCPTWGKKGTFVLGNVEPGKDWKKDKSSFGSQLLENERVPEAYPINAFVEVSKRSSDSDGDSSPKKKRKGNNGLSEDTVEDSDDETDEPVQAEKRVPRCVHLPTSGQNADDQKVYDANNAFLAHVGSSKSFYVDVKIENSKDSRKTAMFQSDVSYNNIRFPKFIMTIIGRAPTSSAGDVQSQKYESDLLQACGY